MSSLPPLNALRAFEAVARTGAFTTAGAELGVTSAAVSQQVRNLEAFWQKKLFIRQGNQLALTEAGTAAYPTIGRAMSTLMELSDTMSEVRQASSLVLSVPYSVAETWLPQKLSTLLSNGDGNDATAVRLQVRVEDDPVEHLGTGVHMRIFYGHELYQEFRVETLFQDHTVGVASPSFVARFGPSIEAIEDRHLIHTSWGPSYATSPSWPDHLPQTRNLDTMAGIRVAASSTALAFARSGAGVALVPAMMALDDLEKGTLVRLDAPETAMPHPYSIAFPNALQNRADLLQVLDALMRE